MTRVRAQCYYERVRRICLSPENLDNYKALFDLGYQSSDDLKAQYAAAFGDSYEYMVPELGALLAAVSKDTRDYSYERDICDDVSLFHGMTLDMARSPPRRRAALPRPPHTTLSCRSSRAACLPSCATSARTRTPRTPRPLSGAGRRPPDLLDTPPVYALLHPSYSAHRSIQWRLPDVRYDRPHTTHSRVLLMTRPSRLRNPGLSTTCRRRRRRRGRPRSTSLCCARTRWATRTCASKWKNGTPRSR